MGNAEQKALEHLTAIRQAIAGEVQNAEGVAAVRAALDRLFEGFIVHRSIREKAHVELIGKVWIEPVVRQQEIEGYTESMTPVFRHTPLDYAEKNECLGLPLHQLFGPIAVGHIVAAFMANPPHFTLETYVHLLDDGVGDGSELGAELSAGESKVRPHLAALDGTEPEREPVETMA